MRRLIEPTAEGVHRNEDSILEAGFVLEREFDINGSKGLSAYNTRIEALRNSGANFRHLVVDEGKRARIYIKNKNSGRRSDSDVDWGAPIEDVRVSVASVLK